MKIRLGEPFTLAKIGAALTLVALSLLLIDVLVCWWQRRVDRRRKIRP
jgi:uncharacterized iron-regulated membrane protein